MATRLNIIENKTTTLMVIPDNDGATDQWIQYSINEGASWRLGVKSSDDSFRLTQGNSFGTDDTMLISDQGEITLPRQSAFHAYMSTTDSNVTGDGTFYTIGTNIAWTARFDQSGDFNSNGTYIAPVTGRYAFRAIVRISDIDASHTGGFITLTASNINLEAPYMYPDAWTYQAGDTTTIYNTVEVDMDAADTMLFMVYVSGGGGATIDIVGSASGNETVFSGYLAV